MLNLNSFLLFSENPKTLVAFYTKVFGKEPEWTGGDFSGWTLGDGMLVIGPHDKVHGKNATPERMILNISSDDVQADFERVKGVGAEVIAEPYHPGEEPTMWISTFSDPDGNFFQLTTPPNLSR